MADEKLTLVRMSKLLGDGVAVAGVTLEAIIDSLEGGTAKNGAYVRAKLADKQDRLELKVWGINLNSFVKEADLMEGTALVQIKGNFEFYNGVPQFTTSYVNGSLPIVKSKNNIADYLDVGQYDGEKVLRGFQKAVDSFVTDEYLHALCVKALEYNKDKLVYYPYSQHLHTEKSGLINHLYEAFKDANGYKSSYGLNNEVVLTAILCSRLGVYTRYKVDFVTGKISEVNEVQIAEQGETANLRVLDWLIEEVIDDLARKKADSKESSEEKRQAYFAIKKVRNRLLDKVRNAVAYTYGIVSSSSPECAAVKAALWKELMVYEMSKRRTTLARGEVSKMVILGETVVVTG